MDPNALYEIHIDNNGDAKEDLSFQFRFTNTLANGGAGITCRSAARTWPSRWCRPVPVANPRDANLNLAETFSVTVVRGDRRTGTAAPDAASRRRHHCSTSRSTTSA
jgi:hypothetical protein